MDNLGEDKVLDVKDHTVKMSLSWDFFEGMPSVDMDAACVCFDLDGKYVDSCYYNRLSILDGCITHSGDQRDGKQEGWDEQITVKLDQAADKCQIMVFLVLAAWVLLIAYNLASKLDPCHIAPVAHELGNRFVSSPEKVPKVIRADKFRIRRIQI